MKKKEREKQAKPTSTLLEGLKTLLIKVGVVALVVFILFHYIFGITIVKNDYMKPRLNPGDGVLYYRLDRQFKGDDAVVYKDSEATRIGRIIAQEGDTVDITNDGKLLVNGHQKDEANPYQILPHSSGPSYPYSVPKNSYFILFDYREERTDSRYLGAISKDSILGIVSTLLRVRGI
ncbi:signal peptidase I [Streptococcus pyogenes]|uniref:signal peptidase I n=1 Tax=Streptococcus pyogenes TaxID=1314 RepID=UPI00109CDD89|nr:signal peptidase I [Streptococcus pyogenes]QCK53796.1 signal peptidase I [Streptococcus pyogenes]VHE03113.1 signal peptidase I [Streptococcus pyogenes]VHE08326.1 signal peptidase I [Streptococcus pyogenes]VHE08811.1 signal peptidase I [Streptococcus pyogenes]VHM34791.1 signal peptidase I [Streptococcus pyogenes]